MNLEHIDALVVVFGPDIASKAIDSSYVWITSAKIFLVLLCLLSISTFAAAARPMIAAGSEHTLALKPDGTVVAVGANYKGQLDVGDWTDIIQVAAGAVHTVGLKSDGSVRTAADSWGTMVKAQNFIFMYYQDHIYDIK